MTAKDLVRTVEAAGGTLILEGNTLRFRLPNSEAHLARLLREKKAEVLSIVRRRGGRVATFPHCPRCASYTLYRQHNAGNYECLTCVCRKSTRPRQGGWSDHGGLY